MTAFIDPGGFKTRVRIMARRLAVDPETYSEYETFEETGQFWAAMPDISAIEASDAAGARTLFRRTAILRSGPAVEIGGRLAAGDANWRIAGIETGPLYLTLALEEVDP